MVLLAHFPLNRTRRCPSVSACSCTLSTLRTSRLGRLVHSENRLARPIKKLFLLGCLLTLAACTNLMFYPSRVDYQGSARLGVETEDIYLPSNDDVVLHGWRLQALGDTRGSVVFLHGNGENISSHIGSVYWLSQHGYDVLLFDYRGYGRSTGTAEIHGVIQDAQRMIAYGQEQALSAGYKVTVLGHSMGGSIAIYALAQLPDQSGVNGLITVSAFSDYHLITRDALANHWVTRPLRWPLSFLVSNRYRPIDFIGKLSPIPVFIMHSQTDDIVPVYHGQHLFESAGPPRFYENLPGAHNQVLAIRQNRKRLLEILNTLH